MKNFKFLALAAVVALVAACTPTEPAEEDSLKVNPTTVSIAAEGGTADVTVTLAGSLTAYTATSNADWATTSTKDMTITITAAANTAEARIAEITVTSGEKSVKVTVNQAGADIVVEGFLSADDFAGNWDLVLGDNEANWGGVAGATVIYTLQYLKDNAFQPCIDGASYYDSVIENLTDYECEEGLFVSGWGNYYDQCSFVFHIQAAVNEYDVNTIDICTPYAGDASSYDNPDYMSENSCYYDPDGDYLQLNMTFPIPEGWGEGDVVIDRTYNRAE